MNKVPEPYRGKDPGLARVVVLLLCPADLFFRCVFSMVGEERMSLHGVKRTLESDGILAPSGGRFWNTNTIRDIVLDDCYRPHSYGEIEELVSPQVAAALDQSKSYGVCWYNRRRVKTRQVGEDKPEGRRYRRVQQTVWRPREEWVGVPVPDAGIPRGLVDAARGLYSTIAHPRGAHTSLNCRAVCSSAVFAGAGWHPTAGVGAPKVSTSATTAATRGISADAKPVRWGRACVLT
jgi:hypothetical protein